MSEQWTPIGTHWDGCWKVHYECAMAEISKLRLKSRFIDLLPFCSDHRDKVRGKPCRECTIEWLEYKLDDAVSVARSVLKNRQSFNPPAVMWRNLQAVVDGRPIEREES